MIDTVIFDIGNVLMGFNWNGYIRTLYEEELAKEVSEAIFLSGYWSEFDRGVMSDDEILGHMIEGAPHLEKEIRTSIAGVAGCMSKYDYAVPWVKSVRNAGYKTLYLSNYSEFTFRAKFEVLSFLPYMDGGVFSCNVHQIKPDLAIYQTITDIHALEPGNCLFIDDTKENVDAAVEFGMHSIQFIDYEQSKGGIDEYLRKNGKYGFAV